MLRQSAKSVLDTHLGFDDTLEDPHENEDASLGHPPT